jgi:hypothetical protein
MLRLGILPSHPEGLSFLRYSEKAIPTMAAAFGVFSCA